MLSSILRSAVVRIVLVINGVILCAAAQAAPPSVTPQMKEQIDAHRVVLDRMNAPDKGGKPRPFDDAQMRLLLTQGWQLAGQWAGAWFDLHPNPSAQDLDHLFVDFTPPLKDPDVYDPNLPERYAMEGFATRIATNIYLVTAAYEESQSAMATSTFFVVAKDANGHFQVKWSIKPLAQSHYRKKDEIGHWAFRGSCAYYCGALVVEAVLPLPPSAKGQPRFAINAFQATNGNTLMKQVSVWQWNGTEAENLVIRPYKLYINESREIHLIGNLLTVPTKETTNSFSSYGCCAEPRGMWIFRINSDHVEDRGHRLLQPQIQWADRLLAAVNSRSTAVESIASPSVIAYLRHTEIEMDAIDECNVERRGKKGAFQISFAVGTKLWFAYELRNGQPYFTEVRLK